MYQISQWRLRVCADALYVAIGDRLVLLTDGGERLAVNGWCCLIEVKEERGEGRGGLTDAG